MMTKQNERLLTKEDWRGKLGWQYLPDDREYKLLNKAREITLKEVGEWLGKHCQGYHKGKNGSQFGHFGIFREDAETFLRGEMPE